MTRSEAGEAGGDYALGHSGRELERLGAQERLVEGFTRRFLLEAGLRPGMRVLDVGCGSGAVSLLAAGLVGGEGEVVGADRAPPAIEAARARVMPGNVSFVACDPAEADFDAPFDAVVGRYVLMFAPDPVAMLRGLRRHLRPGGLVVFHEVDWAGARSVPASPLYDRCNELVCRTFAAVGTDPHIGLGLHAIFTAAGFPAPRMRLSALVGGREEMAAWLHVLAELVVTLRPTMIRLGLADETEIAASTLEERLFEDAGAAVILGRSEIGAWSRREVRDGTG